MAFTHTCGRCGRLFNWPTRQKIYDPECAKILTRTAEQRSKARRRKLTRADAAEVKKSVREQRFHECASCGEEAPKGRCFCETCARRREMNRNAAAKRHARRFDASYPDRAREARFDERYAPLLTRGIV